jgi:phage tail-like protein
MPDGARKDPLLAFRYRVEIDGLVAAGFSDVTGLQVEVDTEDYQEGGTNDYVHKLPKGFKHPNLVLKRGLTDADSFWNWQLSVRKGGARIDRKSLRITLLDSEGQEKVSWRCLRTWPVKWTGPELKAESGTVALETLELAHCGIQRV